MLKKTHESSLSSKSSTVRNLEERLKILERECKEKEENIHKVNCAYGCRVRRNPTSTGLLSAYHGHRVFSHLGIDSRDESDKSYSTKTIGQFTLEIKNDWGYFRSQIL